MKLRLKPSPFTCSRCPAVQVFYKQHPGEPAHLFSLEPKEVRSMKKTWFAVSALALSLGATSGGLVAKAYAAPASPAPAGFQEGRWDEAPSEYREAQRTGFRDGMEA